MNKQSIPENPLVKLLKVKKGYLERITPKEDGRIDFILQQLLYSYEQNKNNSNILDYTPIVLILSISQDKKIYNLFDSKIKVFQSGIYGLNLNLLFSSSSEENNKIIFKLKQKIISLYLLYINTTAKGLEKIKQNIISELKSIVLELMIIDKSKKIFDESPFNVYETKHILYSKTLDDIKLVNHLKENLIPKSIMEAHTPKSKNLTLRKK